MKKIDRFYIILPLALLMLYCTRNKGVKFESDTTFRTIGKLQALRDTSERILPVGDSLIFNIEGIPVKIVRTSKNTIYGQYLEKTIRTKEKETFYKETKVKNKNSNNTDLSTNKNEGKIKTDIKDKSTYKDKSKTKDKNKTGSGNKYKVGIIPTIGIIFFLFILLILLGRYLYKKYKQKTDVL